MMPRSHPSTPPTLRRASSSPLAPLLPGLLAVVMAGVLAFSIVLPSYKASIIRERRRLIHELVHTVTNDFALLEDRVHRGELSRVDAQRQAKALVHGLRFGRDGKNYFWVTDLQQHMVAHPYRRDLEGRDLSDYVDADGVPVFRLFTEIAKTKGEGYVNYVWQWKDQPTRHGAKVSYVELFQPWGWIVGAGLYLDDLAADIARLSRTILLALFAMLVVTAALTAWLFYVSLAEHRRRRLFVAELRRSEARYRMLAEHASDLIWTADTDGRLTYVSPSVTPMLGYAPEVTGTLRLSDWVLGAGDAARLAPTDAGDASGDESVTSPASAPVEIEMRRADGSRLWTESHVSAVQGVDGVTVGWVGVTRDIERRKLAELEQLRLEAQLRQAQKMESLGTLAGGIAHDFNNVLASILGLVELSMERVSDEVREDLHDVVAAAERARDLVRQILTFSRHIEERREAIAVDAIIEEALRMLRATLPPTVVLETHLEAKAARVLGDASQIHQVIVNLCTNALHALPPEGGRIAVTLRVAPANPGFESRAPALAQGRIVYVEVRDDGHGIPESDLPHIFDPFFTTKDVGAGTGLGLSVVHGIVSSHHGIIDVETHVGLGTAFRIYLPELPQESEPEAEEIALPIAQHHHRVLVVEDEVVLARLVARQLQELGHDAVAETDPHEALRRIAREPTRFDVLLTDQMMPRMTGLDLVERIRGHAPNLHILLATGGAAEEQTRRRAEELGVAAVLLKPVSLQQLNAILARLGADDDAL